MKANGILDDCYKSENRIAKNFFYLGTCALILINFLLFFCVTKTQGDDWAAIYIYQKEPKIPSMLLASFAHLDFEHVALNMLSLLVVGVFFERKYGTASFVAAYLIFSILANTACYFVCKSENAYISYFVGASTTLYTFYGFLYVQCIAGFKKVFHGLQGYFYGACMVYITIALFFGGIDSALLKNLHWPGFVVGICISAFIYLIGLVQPEKEKR